MKPTTSIADILRRPYTRVVKPDEAGIYVATVREFPGCVADGDTALEALERLEAAAESWLEAAVAMGQKIPEPLSEPVASGKFALRLPRSMHQQAIERAAIEGTSVNQFFITAIAYRLGAKEAAEHSRTKVVASRAARQSEPFRVTTDTSKAAARAVTTATDQAYKIYLKQPFDQQGSTVSGEIGTFDQLVAARKQERRTKENNG